MRIPYVAVALGLLFWAIVYTLGGWLTVVILLGLVLGMIAGSLWVLSRQDRVERWR